MPHPLEILYQATILSGAIIMIFLFILLPIANGIIHAIKKRGEGDE